MVDKLGIINVDQWIEENKASFVPPVCNKLMHGDGQLKIMFIGGPNQRKDYHIEEGEERWMYRITNTQKGRSGILARNCMRGCGMPGTQVRKSACKQSAQHSCGLGSMQIPLEHMKTVQEFPDLLFCVLVMQNMQKREVWFFFQLKGDMCLKIVEKDSHKDVDIKEGECYLHPSRIPHSPQRFDNTVGLVIERERSKKEFDGLRYYIDGSTDPLWEEWFYCYDLGTQLGPVIKKYFASEEHKTGRPPPNKVFDPPPVEIDTTTTTHKPFSMNQWISDNAAEIKEKGYKQLFGDGEFKITVWGEGDQDAGKQAGEAFLWQLEGEADVTCDRGTGRLTKGSCVLIKAGESFTVKRPSNSIGIVVTTDPLANKVVH